MSLSFNDRMNTGVELIQMDRSEQHGAGTGGNAMDFRSTNGGGYKYSPYMHLPYPMLRDQGWIYGVSTGLFSHDTTDGDLLVITNVTNALGSGDVDAAVRFAVPFSANPQIVTLETWFFIVGTPYATTTPGTIIKRHRMTVIDTAGTVALDSEQKFITTINTTAGDSQIYLGMAIVATGAAQGNAIVGGTHQLDMKSFGAMAFATGSAF